MPPVIHRDKCIRCTLCAQICPLDVIRVTGAGKDRDVEVRYPDECWHCRACVMDCPKGAIELEYPLAMMLLAMESPVTQGKRKGEVK